MIPSDNVPLACGDVDKYISGSPIVENCDVLRDGSLRLKTILKYPNGSNIDVILERRGDLMHPVRLSDYGNTAEFLINIGLDPWAHRKRRETIEELCHSLGVSIVDKELSIIFDVRDPITTEAILRLGQACIRVAGLHLTKRQRSSGIFKEEFEERVLADGPDYESDFKLPSRYGQIVKLDFRIQGRHSTSLLQTLSSPNPTAAHQVANEAFTKWYDLAERRTEFQFLTVYDSDNPGLRDVDLKRLEDVSLVLAFPSQAEAIIQAIAA